MEAEAAVSGFGAELSDAALVGLYRDGAGEFAFAELVRRHQIAVFRLLLTLLGDADRAERACEQVFFDAARRLGELQAPDGFYSWVAGLARARAQKLEAESQKSKPPERPRSPPKDPRAAVKRHVKDVLRTMSGDERVALVLADLEGDSFEAIAATLGTSVPEAEALVTQAREKFVLALTEGEGASAPGESAASSTGSLPPGSVLGGRYRIERMLGKGGMGAVYSATDLESGTTVALKTLLPAAAADASLRRRFEREAELLRRLAHPNFVRFLAYGNAPDEPTYVVMEFVDGTLMSQLLKLESRLPPQRALHIVRHLLTGLGFAHGLGVVHRDIKPENVMLLKSPEDDDFAKILDLGIARAFSPEDLRRTQLTEKNEVFGTPTYMSPEQVRGEAVDGRSDLYSVTALLFELLSAHPPFEAKSPMALFAMHLASEPPALFDVAPDLRVPSGMQELLDRGLAKEKDERFESAAEYLKKVDALLGADWSHAGPPTPRAEPRHTPLARRETVKRPAANAPLPQKSRAARARERLRRIPFSAAVALIALVVYAVYRGIRYLSE
ncbi:MAG TPA: protein kinase [Polyangiaceae bacterium]|nr:protein kinase [Polyangiaceae bacterium]